MERVAVDAAKGVVRMKEYACNGCIYLHKIWHTNKRGNGVTVKYWCIERGGFVYKRPEKCERRNSGNED